MTSRCRAVGSLGFERAVTSRDQVGRRLLATLAAGDSAARGERSTEVGGASGGRLADARCRKQCNSGCFRFALQHPEVLGVLAVLEDDEGGERVLGVVESGELARRGASIHPAALQDL